MDRPRRSTRQTAKPGTSTSASSVTRPKRVSQAADPTDILKSLLESPKSILTKVDVTDVFNIAAWEMLSDESRNELSKLLPPTGSIGYKSSLDASHPASANMMDVDQEAGPLKPLDPYAVFNNPHLLSAANTFQDHLYSGWLAQSHLEKVEVFLANVRSGTMAAPWKDDVWLSEHPEAQSNTEGLSGTNMTGTLTSCLSGLLAGGAAQVKFTTLVKEGILEIGDILAYRRNFTNVNITVEKDAIISEIHPKTHAITVLTSPGVAKDLPADVLNAVPTSSDTNPPSQSSMRLTNIASPSMLETGLLDLDARLDKTHRPNGNAWKTLTVWRLRPGIDPSTTDSRGGKENHGTLFYLRSIYYNEQ